MILIDANLPLYAEDMASPFHAAAKRWWDEQLSGSTAVCLSWLVIDAFIRISTHPRAFKSPNSIRQAIARVDAWIESPCVRILQPTPDHWRVFRDLLGAANATSNLVADAHLAALAVEHGCTLMSTDTDFARFPALRWQNPIA